MAISKCPECGEHRKPFSGKNPECRPCYERKRRVYGVCSGCNEYKWIKHLGKNECAPCTLNRHRKNRKTCLSCGKRKAYYDSPQICTPCFSKSPYTHKCEKCESRNVSFKSAKLCETCKNLDRESKNPLCSRCKKNNTYSTKSDLCSTCYGYQRLDKITEVCSTEDCTNKVDYVTLNICSSCYNKVNRSFGSCVGDSGKCGRPVENKMRSLCSAHYNRYLKGLPVDEPIKKVERQPESCTWVDPDTGEHCTRKPDCWTVCQTHRGAWERKNRKEKHYDRIYRGLQKRRTDEKEKFVEAVSPFKLREMYGDECFLCGKTMEFEWDKTKYQPHYRNIEHLVPISRGGETSYDNCRLACFVCNKKKGTKTLDEFRENHVKN